MAIVSLNLENLSHSAPVSLIKDQSFVRDSIVKDPSDEPIAPVKMLG